MRKLKRVSPPVTSRHSQGYLHTETVDIKTASHFLPDEHVRLDGEEDVAVDDETVDKADGGDELEGIVGLDGKVHHDDHPDGEQENREGSQETPHLPAGAN